MAPLSDTIELTQALIRRASVTPADSGCQALLAERLTRLGFTCQSLRFGEVDNLWAVRGEHGPYLMFAGHTDVVPTGPLERWRHPPFDATIDSGWLYGRGSADMKGGIAAFVTAVERLLARQSSLTGRIALLITSDEEGPAIDGTVRVVEWLDQQGIYPEWCLVGEPSSRDQLGDVIKNGRRGSLNGRLTVMGQQGHIAYPHLADNPIHRAAPFLAELTAIEWDQGNDHFPQTRCQISNIHAGTGASNVIPGELVIDFNFRFGTASSAEGLQQRVEALLQQHAINYRLEWHLSGGPFVTEPGPLLAAAQQAVQQQCGISAEVNTSGGTSDGRFIARLGTQVIELGLLNATIHQIDERVAIADLDRLSAIYEQMLTTLLVA